VTPPADLQQARGADPATPAAPTQAPAPGRPVQLHELPAAAGASIRVAVRDGQTEAVLQLSPGDLGQVQIRLRYGADGVSAQIVADSAVAAQALRETASELRRSLESQGIVVRDLDVSTSGSGRSQGDNEQRRPGATRSAFPSAGDAGDDQGPAAPVRRSVLGLVDVLA